MKLILTLDDQWVKQFVYSVLQNLPECSISLRCTSWDYATPTTIDRCRFKLLEEDDDGKLSAIHILTLKRAVRAFKTLVEEWTDKGTYQIDTLLDAGNWDAPMVDSLVQVAVLGEEVYC